MNKNRLFHLLMVVTLVLVVAVSVRDTLAATNLTSGGNESIGTRTLECASLPSRRSLHTETVRATGTRLTFTEDGPTGVDGGLVNLLSDYRTCSK